MRKRKFYFAVALIAAMFTQTIMAQPATVRVRFSGKAPDINDFVTSFARAYNGSEDFSTFSSEVVKGTHGYAYAEIVSDTRNGYASYKTESGIDGSVKKLEMCYWNCTGGKSKIVAVNVLSLYGGKTDRSVMTFYRYDNATRVMKKIAAPFDRKVRPVDYTGPQRTRPSVRKKARSFGNREATGEWAPIYTLPQQGKNIELRIANGSLLTLAERQWIRYNWTGNGFRLVVVED